MLPDDHVAEESVADARLPDDCEDAEVALPAKIERILERLPPEDRKQASVVMRSMVSRYSGPVPHAAEMALYKDIDTSFPERFMLSAERQSSHRQSLETKVMDDDFNLKRRGQDYALISIVVGLLVALTFGYWKEEVVAGIVGGTTVVGVVAAFVTGQISKASNNTAEGEEDN